MRVMLVALVVMAMATLARALVGMILMPIFTLRGLMIVAVGHRPTTVTMHLTAKRLLAELSLAAATTTAAAFCTAVSR